MTHRTQGFTLLELSVVIGVIALILGGIIVGTNLNHNAQLQSVVNDFDRYTKAIQLFKDKYSELPGDMPTATSLWGTDAGCPNTAANATPKKATCNGNGDTYIGDVTGSALGGATYWYESYRVWQQLANEGLIPSSYTGALSSRTTGNNADPGMNIPGSTIPNNGFTILHVVPGSAAGVFNANYHHVFVYGIPAGQYASAYNPGLTTIDAMAIDQKIDDAKPGQGNVLSFTSAMAATPNCASSAVESSATYKTTTSGLQCSLIFITGF